jgi:Uncharacterised nucleotidyltransferase
LIAVANAETPAEISVLLDAMKHAAQVLRAADVPYALCGGLATFARGGTASEHDVDFLIREQDVERALAALCDAGMRTERPPLPWLVKAYQDDILIDLIFRPVERPVTEETLADVDQIPIAAAMVPVLSGTELLIHSLLTLTVHECDLSAPLRLTRAIREQIDFARVRDQTKDSPYARAFLYLADELELTGGPRT